jgi:hypothetical protein
MIREAVMFGFGKKKIIKTYDKENLVPILHSSICTGETTAGFKNIHSGAYQEVMLITSADDLKEFKKTYGITEDLKTEY